MKKDSPEKTDKSQLEKTNNTEYVSPKITSYTNEEIMDQIGPAQAGTGPMSPG